MTQQDAIRKAMACLRLAKSSNANEAALAASKAQEIIERFKLDISALDYDQNAAVEDNEPIVDFGSDPLEATDKESRIWSLALSSLVARSNQCRVYYSQLATGYALKIVGHPSDVQTVRYIYSYLKSEVLRLKTANCTGHSNSYKGQYCRGVVDAIREKLSEQSKKTQAEVRAENANNPLALVRVNNAIARLEKRANAVDAFIKSQIRLVKGRSTFGQVTSAVGASARAQGQRDGQSVRITRAVGALN